MIWRRSTQAAVFAVLITGFLLELLLLTAAAGISLLSIRSIKESAANLVGEEMMTTRLLDDIQREQAALSAVFMKLSHAPEAVDRERVLSELNNADRAMTQIGEAFVGTAEEPLWKELKAATAAFSAEARRLLALEAPTTLLSRDLFRRHQEALAVVAKIAAATDAHAAVIRREIEARSSGLMRQTVILLGACLLLASASAALTVRTVGGLFRRMERQAGELSRVSWHMLENQETAARRFSHELHDELGQTLMAVKANLHALSLDNGAGQGRLQDTIALINQAIGNVRELSQLLHPTVLDDFGVEPALRWLSERFGERTGMEVQYESDFAGRLPAETETHLFRICQEALTNAAKHSGAKRVRIRLARSGDNVRLSIEDDGRGLPAGVRLEERGMGLIGMRARARSAGGEVAVRSQPGKGVLIVVEVPARGEHVAQENSRLVGR